ncbi:hypothetical protein BH09BAC3_BH09BAC3_03230 [soil metagenome]
MEATNQKMNLLKLVFTVLFYLAVSIPFSYGQLAGIYLSKEDFNSNSISTYAVDGGKLRRGVNGSLVLVDEIGNQSIFKREEIYGYQNGNDVYRNFCKGDNFKNCGFYKIEDESGIIVYSKPANAPRTGIQIEYYYSLNRDTQIKSFTRMSLLEDFALNRSFTDYLLKTPVDKLKQRSHGRFIINVAYNKFKIHSEDSARR